LCAHPISARYGSSATRCCCRAAGRPPWHYRRTRRQPRRTARSGRTTKVWGRIARRYTTVDMEPECFFTARGRQLGVTHGVLDAHQVDATGNEQRSEGVAQIVPAQRPQAGGVASVLVAAAQRRVVERTAEGIAEDIVIRGAEIVTPGQAVQGGRGLVGHRHTPDVPGLGRPSTPEESDRLMVSAEPVQSTSRQSNARSSPRRNPEKAATRTASLSVRPRSARARREPRRRDGGSRPAASGRWPRSSRASRTAALLRRGRCSAVAGRP
jgi:hypothetical protein